MLKLFKATETNFDHNETILKDVVSAEVLEESNGEFSLTIEYPAKLNLEAGQIIEAPTPRGPQLFRIVKPTRVIGKRDYFRAYCRHIFYDLLDNFIEDIRPTNKTAGGALEDILSSTQYAHRFTGASDISATNTAYYIRQNPVQAIMGSGNSVLGLWGGHIVRDNFEITIKEHSLDRGYEVRFGKNLIGLDEEIDVTEVVTRIYPTAVINEPVVTALPEKYIDSPLIGTYPEPIIRELRVELTDTEKELPVSEIYDIMRQKAQEQFTLGGDKPLVNYKVNFLHYTNDNAEILKQLDLNDTVRVVIDKYGINLSAKVIKYTYDSIKEKYLSMELGNFKESLANQRVEIGQIIDEINKTISNNNVSIADKMKAIGDMISGNNGGYKIERFNDLGQPYETLYMDSPNLNTATNVMRVNKSGIGFSTSGYNGPFNTAITIDGKIMGQYIVVNALDAISANFGTMTAGRIEDEDGESYWDLDNKEIKLNVNELKINSKDVATKSDLTFTSENLTAKFSQIGGENLFKDSEDLSRWVLYQGATMVSGYPLQESVPEWSTDEAWRVRTTSLGSSDIKAYINISSDLAKLRSRPFTFSVYAKNNRADASVRIGTNRFGSEILAPSEMKRIIISGENDNGMFMQLQLSAQTANHYLDVTLYHPKFETGWIATDWNDHLYTGITRIDKDGGHFGREGETIETGIAFDGVRIEDDGKEIASFIASGSVISDLQVVGTITGNVINSIDESLTFNVGSGDGYYANISEVMRAIGNRKYLKYGTKLTINIYGTLNETMIIDGFSGGGEIEINLYGKINGNIRTSSNSCAVKVYGKNSTQVVSGSGNAIISSSDSYALFNGLNVDSKNTSSGIGILSQNGSDVYVENCDFVNTNDALYSMSGGKIQALNNKGNPTRFACMASSGRIWARGTVPDGGNYGFVDNFDELTRTPSAFSPPPTTTTAETLVFNHTDIYTYSVKYGARSTHYGKAAAQNRWDTSMTQMKGRISFGTSVYNFIAGRDSGTTPTVKLRLRRQNSTHGTSASVAPTPEWSGSPSFGGATRGNWTPWVTIPYTMFTSSGYTFSFYNGTTGYSYAIWDRAEVQITRTITQ